MQNEDIKKELQEMSKVLSKMSKIEDKEVPQGYFNKLPDVIWDKISSDQKPLSNSKSIQIPMFGKLIGIAASFALVFFVISNKTVKPSEEVSVDTLIEYIIDDLANLDDELLSDWYSESGNLVELEDETLEYLLEEEIDLIDDKILETLY